ncbi:hypothetical protein [Streptomyces sp. V1I1]|uniref:hypothetical protein n=1 Tax=Streptomyces sp. V1I1 TaxID=3042272 RepID=UPI0027D8E056|nr:hypothetical protein [Streptomyces sp. V1I1]
MSEEHVLLAQPSLAQAQEERRGRMGEQGPDYRSLSVHSHHEHAEARGYLTYGLWRLENKGDFPQDRIVTVIQRALQRHTYDT